MPSGLPTTRIEEYCTKWKEGMHLDVNGASGTPLGPGTLQPHSSAECHPGAEQLAQQDYNINKVWNPKSAVLEREPLNAMAGLAEASAIIGITDVGLKGVNFLYTYIKDLKNAPEIVRALRGELELLQRNLHGLQSVKVANDEIQNDVRETGLVESLQKCNQSCEQLQKDFDVWTKRGLDSFRSKVQIRRNKTKIEGTVASIRNTQRILHCAVSILNLRLQLSRGFPFSENEPNVQQVVLWRRQAESDRTDAMSEAAGLEKDAYDGDIDAEVTAAELAKQANASSEFIALYDKIIPRLQGISQTVQEIGNTITEEEGMARIGMPKEVVPLVKSQKVGDTYTGKGASTTVGIW
ncbi:hypothetical protein FKW77_007700 [Venturia effusa]|uniref:Azaphilone pigments biosynthesis cluster protein L N-terminal domain-containing protein n=1 Tax=Venturia effusa TaxID=50376 RepID=A0A517LHT6_9PEZI|nr:hypothetical protein FKW77_007700 [Venturia effusa]